MPPLVPTYPLSRGSLSPVTHSCMPFSFFSFWPALMISKALPVIASSLSLPLLFFHLSHCSLLLLSFLSAVILAQQLRWHACRIVTPFPCFRVCLSPFCYLSMPYSLSCARLWHCRDQFTWQQLRQASFVPGLPSEKAFFTSGELLTAHSDIECLIALPPNLEVLIFSGSPSSWTRCTVLAGRVVHSFRYRYEAQREADCF